MAPEKTGTPSLKRPSPDSDHLPTIPAKKQKIEYHRVHRLQSPLNVQSLDSAVIADDASVDQLLNMAISISLREAGFDHAEPVALDSFRDGVEEYLLRFLSYIRASMASCRRTQPIPCDFEHALHQQAISLDSLRPYLRTLHKTKQPPVILSTPPPDEPVPQTYLPFLGPQLSASDDKQKYSYIPKQFPRLPSRHTYQRTAVYTERETDPRKVREQATEEGRLGEEALRKLTRAAKESRLTGEEMTEKRLWGRETESMQSMFEKTLAATLQRQAEEGRKHKEMKTHADAAAAVIDFDSAEPVKQKTPDLLGINPQKLEFGPVVNCERVYWRKFTVSGTRRAEQQKDTSAKPAREGGNN
ncbi:predicted protein [Uncinocarpus reesii 1704]|uniref:Transcription initiation factor TFIID subunit 8 n=1 Tax=Uncinocarpus reesii (strain UAMH 1704) TaxID=336963 RepID=C4JWT3_UNCRE|nr:uncharacterized protein UREG_06106 [Uncinocarpus reesii 1704]EEP81241.1 predicted protein [Uncinocarpus reesii 1704]